MGANIVLFFSWFLPLPFYFSLRFNQSLFCFFNISLYHEFLLYMDEAIFVTSDINSVSWSNTMLFPFIRSGCQAIALCLPRKVAVDKEPGASFFRCTSPEKHGSSEVRRNGKKEMSGNSFTH